MSPVVLHNSISDKKAHLHFGKIESEEAFNEQIKCIQRSIYKKNQSGQLEFTLGTSIGNTLYRALEIEDLNEIIELADQKMYMEKRKKKKGISYKTPLGKEK